MTTAPDFRQDWGGVVRDTWPAMFEDSGMTGAQNLHFLEIGCFEGRTTLWLFENVLTEPSSRLTVIDTFTGSPEFDSIGVSRDFHGRFLANVAPHADRLTVCEGRSHDVLPTLTGQFDFVFVDGSHRADDVWQDAVLAWPLLRPGGLLVFDDYLWGDQKSEHSPRIGVDRFLDEYADLLHVVHMDYQVTVEKL